MHRFFYGRGKCGAGRSDLFFEFGDFAAKTGSLGRLRNASVLKIRAQFSVFPQKVKRKERGESHKYQEEDGNQFNHRLRVSLVVPDLLRDDLCSNVRTVKSQNLAFYFGARPSSYGANNLIKIKKLEEPPEKSWQDAGMLIRKALESDEAAIWAILEHVIRAGETYPLVRDMDRQSALAYWFSPGHEVYVTEDRDEIVGTYFLKANQKGGGAHVSNCGYMTAPHATGRGVARAMCEHSLERGFRSMQFNFVVSTNERAVRLWSSFGFEIVGRLPRVFEHPTLGFVDAFVMCREL